MEIFLTSFFNIEVARLATPLLLQGLQVTLILCAIVVPGGLALGFLVALLFSLSPRWFRFLVYAYIDFFRAIPPLVLLTFIYFGAPFLGFTLPAIVAVSIAMILNSSGYYSEIFRSGIESIPSGQIEAARATGLTRIQSLFSVSVPQAVRTTLPDLVGNTVELVKGTSIASVVALPELMRMARVAQGVTYNPTPLIMAAAIYLVLLWPVVRLLSRLERKTLGGR